MELKVAGKITKVLPPVSGTTKSGTKWAKMTFVIDNGDQYNSTFAFEIWKDDKILAFNEHNSVGDSVLVHFNVDCNEYKGKFYTSLKAWKVEPIDAQIDLNNTQVDEYEEVHAEVAQEDGDEDFPF